MEEAKEMGFEDGKELVGSVTVKKVASCDALVSESPECEKASEEIEICGGKMEERENDEVGFVSSGENNLGEIEGTVDEKEESQKECEKSQVGFSGFHEFDSPEVSEKDKAFEVKEGSFSNDDERFLTEEQKEVESLLEFKKKQLLAELEAGSIFKEKTHVENASGFDTKAGILGGLRGVDESVRCSLKLEVIDDTALIEPVLFPKSGVSGVKVFEKNVKRDGKQETDGKKAKRPRRRGKDLTKVSETNEKQKKQTQHIVGQNRMAHFGEKNGGSSKGKYSREDMEALRFLNIVEQQNLWKGIFASLEETVAKEYVHLVNSGHQKKIRNSDPRQSFGRKEDIPIFLGEASSENVENDIESNEEYNLENVYAADPACCHKVEGEKVDLDLGEGECSEEYDSDEDYASIRRPALHVEGEPDFDSGPPEDGLEYLRRVKWEAARIPNVTMAKLDQCKVNKEQSVYMPQIPDIAKCPQHLLPLKQWEDALLADFSELRLLLSCDEDSSTNISQKLQTLSIDAEENASFSPLAETVIVEKFNHLRTNGICFNKPLDDSCLENTVDQPSVTDYDDSTTSIPPQNPTPKSTVSDSSCSYPSLSAILAMDSVARVSTLRKRISLVETMDSLSEDECMWLFGLCAAIDTPLDADTCAALRSLLRKCAGLRAQKSEANDEVIMLNVLATISGKYFGQSEN